MDTAQPSHPCASITAINKPASYQFRFALLETVIFLLATVTLDRMFGDGTRFIGTGLHPFWIIVLAVTLQYGAKEALAAALLASLFLLVGNMPEQSLTETLYDYIARVAFLPLAWIATALVLGGIRSRQIHEKQRLLEQLAHSENTAETIATAYTALKQKQEKLELRLAEEDRSVLTAYKAAKILETAETASYEDTLKAMAQLVRVALNPQKFSFYRWQDNAFCLDATEGWHKSDSYNPRFASSTKLAQSLLGRAPILSIIYEKDADILGDQGMLAGLIRDKKTGRIIGMLKIEEITFLRMSIRMHEIFQIVCEWISHVYAKAENGKVAALVDKTPKGTENLVTLPPQHIPYARSLPTSQYAA